MTGALPFSIEGEGVRLAIRVTPRASRNGIGGIVDAGGKPALQVRLAAPPVDGAANKALVAFLAEALAVRKSDVVILSGETGRVKMLRIAGDTNAIAAQLRSFAEL